ncbi:hypothetical protein CC78DRAFT_621285 [Lojkania enalia]|uniref:Uncharacterized protein n=1 Tax=Lojkania enalia TaxID=147567 RepID=A0A9P4K0L8_9PLEO|nr:hypothetical protein CC78DRAFT_621285 [Didymosphaeria enalia]
MGCEGSLTLDTKTEYLRLPFYHLNSPSSLTQTDTMAPRAPHYTPNEIELLKSIKRKHPQGIPWPIATREFNSLVPADRKRTMEGLQRKCRLLGINLKKPIVSKMEVAPATLVSGSPISENSGIESGSRAFPINSEVICDPLTSAYQFPWGYEEQEAGCTYPLYFFDVLLPCVEAGDRLAFHPNTTWLLDEHGSVREG